MARRGQGSDGKAVLGVHAPGMRPTRRGALWLALAVTLPCAALLLAGQAVLVLWPG